jgi:hypothetical protein
MNWTVRIHQDRVEIGERFAVSFQRTLRIPDDGKSYPLPPTLGVFPLRWVADFRERLPPGWYDPGGPPAVFLPMAQREAMWLAFEADSWKPNAVKIGLGQINALTGSSWDEPLHSDPQDYLVCPHQPWLDGVKTGPGVIRQFVAMPFGEGYSIEGQLRGQESVFSLQLVVYDPRPGLFPDQLPPARPFEPPVGKPLSLAAPAGADQSLGLAAGGQIVQKIYPDPYGLQTWSQTSAGRVRVFILNSQAYQSVTGEKPPPSPISAKTYTEYGFPWFSLYDENLEDLTPAESLSGVESVRQHDQRQGSPPGQEEIPPEISESQVHGIQPEEEPRLPGPEKPV